MLKPLTAEGKQRVEAILTRAAGDIEFRELLLVDPEAALSDADLTEDERRALTSMRRVALEEWGVDVRQFRTFLMDNGAKIA